MAIRAREGEVVSIPAVWIAYAHTVAAYGMLSRFES